jgi:hypothetical protein
MTHLLCEIEQLPLYTFGQAGTLGAKAIAVTHCTAGDVIMAT